MTRNAGTILVVEDDVSNRMLLATSLEEQGYQVEIAEDGQQVLSMLRARPFDVVLLDLLVPEMDGDQVLEQIKRDSELKQIPVIVILVLDEMNHVIRCIQMGATDYLLKPLDPVLLRARVNASLADKRMRDMEKSYSRERYIRRGKSTLDEREARASVILHEMAHMWFGNLVTLN